MNYLRLLLRFVCTSRRHTQVQKDQEGTRGGTARPVKEAEIWPENRQDQTPSGPSVAKANRIMILISPCIAGKSVQW